MPHEFVSFGFEEVGVFDFATIFQGIPEVATDCKTTCNKMQLTKSAPMYCLCLGIALIVMLH